MWYIYIYIYMYIYIYIYIRREGVRERGRGGVWRAELDQAVSVVKTKRLLCTLSILLLIISMYHYIALYYVNK